MDNIFYPKKLTRELQAAGLPVAGVSSTGRVDYTRELTKAEAIQARAVIDAHDPKLTDDEIQAGLIAEAGVSLQDMVMALWAQAARGDASAVSTLAERIDGALNGM